ncbi:MAG: response regulator transcription factor [Ktedonobacterales bacterium]
MQRAQDPTEHPSGVMATRLGRQSRRRGSVWLVPTTPQAEATSVPSNTTQTVGALALDEAPACDAAVIATPAPACVLIVEDDPHIAALLRNAFELEGRPDWSIDIMPEGRAALAQAQQAAPRVVLLDVRLPDMDGAEVFRRLRETPGSEDCQVVFLTAASSLDLSLRGVDGGVLVRKPFDVEQVIALVGALLEDA